MSDALVIARADDEATLAAARALVRAHVLAHSTAHDAAGADALAASLPGPFAPPTGGLWVARAGDEPLGCIALRALAPDVGEIKRMYVRPEHRGRGVAGRLARHAIAEARAIGYARLRLGTLDTMHAAQRLYARLGFVPIAPYRPVEFGHTLFFELALGDGAAGDAPR